MQNLFELGTAHGTRLIVRKSDNNASHIADDKVTDAHARLYIYIPEPDNTLCYMISDPGEVARFYCTGCAGTFVAIPFERSAGTEAGSISLADTWRREFLCALPPSEGGNAEVSRSGVAAWESFFPIAVEAPSAAVVALCDEIRSGHNGEGVVTAKAFLEMLSSGQLDSDMTESLGRLMPVDECRRLVAELDARPELEDDLARANPLDRWATEAIPALGAWLRNGRPSGAPVRTLSPDFDFVEFAEHHGKIWSFPMLLNGLRRQAVKPTRKACILATARNEGIYLVEWIAHHRALGFEAFYIYTNNNTDDSDQLLELLAAKGIINLIHNQIGATVRPQYKAYGHALQFVPDILDYAWVAVIDLDEFVRINHHNFACIGDFLNWFDISLTDSIGLSWKLYGPNRNVFWRDQPLTQRFLEPERNANDHLKSIFRTNKFYGTQCHYPYQVKYEHRIYRYSNGTQISEGPFYTSYDYRFAWIDHFWVKSIEEMAVRRSRNRGDHPVKAEMDADHISTSQVELYLRLYDLEGGEYMTDEALDQRRRTEIENLMVLPGVALAVDRCKAAFKAEADQVKMILAANTRFQTSGTPEARMLDLLQSPP